MNRLAQKIKEERIKSGLTEKVLSERSGVALSHLLAIESGKKIPNEATAEKLLKAMGGTLEFIPAEKEVPKEEKKKAPQPVTPVKPTEQWTDVLAGVIRKYVISGEQSGKAVGEIEHVISSKKVDGHAFDKIFYIQLESGDFENHRLKRGDVLSVLKTDQPDGNGLFYIRLSGKSFVAEIKKTGGSKVFVSSPLFVQEVSEDKIAFLGRCIKATFWL
ncbi:MAG: hypothetical protein PWQ12_1538 [Clostridiales bacterium]|jgi:transcriptional regulator with XRE-family HTH domain|nr:hypothetical protein [Clostridiales bacterium]